MQRRLIYFPSDRLPSFAVLGAGWDDVSYETTDGLVLHAWLHAPEAVEPTVIVFNGNAGNRGDRAGLGRSLAAIGVGVLLVDYRGYGGNPGRPSEAGLAKDALAAIRFVEELAPSSPLVFFGESLGAAVSIEAATATSPAALVLRSPFTSLVDVGRVHYPWLPVGLLLKDRYPSIERIAGVDAPTLVILGSADSIVPSEQSRMIFEAAPDPKELVMIDGADHNDEELVSGVEVVAAIARFVGTSTP